MFWESIYKKGDYRTTLDKVVCMRLWIQSVMHPTIVVWVEYTKYPYTNQEHIYSGCTIERCLLLQLQVVSLSSPKKKKSETVITHNNSKIPLGSNIYTWCRHREEDTTWKSKLGQKKRWKRIFSIALGFQKWEAWSNKRVPREIPKSEFPKREWWKNTSPLGGDQRPTPCRQRVPLGKR